MRAVVIRNDRTSLEDVVVAATVAETEVLEPTDVAVIVRDRRKRSAIQRKSQLVLARHANICKMLKNLRTQVSYVVDAS